MRSFEGTLFGCNISIAAYISDVDVKHHGISIVWSIDGCPLGVAVQSGLKFGFAAMTLCDKVFDLLVAKKCNVSLNQPSRRSQKH